MHMMIGLFLTFLAMIAAWRATGHMRPHMRIRGLRVASATMLLLGAVTLGQAGCVTGKSGAIDPAVSGGIKKAVGAVADLAACSAASRGPLATYLAGNVGGARELVSSTSGGPIVGDILCALMAVANALPSEPIAGGFVPGVGQPPTAGPAAPAIPTGATGATGVPTGRRVPRADAPVGNVDLATRTAARDLLLDLCSGEGRRLLEARGITACVNLSIKISCLMPTAGAALAPGQEFCK